MTPERWREIRRALDEVLAQPAEERREHLLRVCGHDAGLLEEVEALLALDRSDGFLERSPSLPGASRAAAIDAAAVPERGLGVGDRVGAYTIAEEIGRGGMGVVYRAVQEEPIRRDVALKLVKLGMDTERVLARFDSERRALALMSHPNVAAVLDAGATPDGRPYFAMEYIDGLPIAEFCDRGRLGLRERLELLTHVCRGIQHAHQKGIIHRDLKPSNVLVAVVDGEPVPKIIDFGIAKATRGESADLTRLTVDGQLVGTPSYMSPEQTGSDETAVDTRSDVYSLGVILYELATGRLPLETRPAAGGDVEDLRRLVRETEPAAMAVRVAGLGDEAASVAEARGTDPASLARSLAGDIEWVVQKALAKDPDRRYAAISELSDDLTRYLRDETLLARPPSAGYRVRKFVRRHRLGVGVAALVALSLATTAILSSIGLVRAERAEAAALKQAEKATAISDFLMEMMTAGNPEDGQGRDTTVLEALDAGLDRIGQRFADQPETESFVRNAIGNTYRALGRHEEARAQLERAIELLERVDPTNPDASSLHNNLGLVFRERGDHVAAEREFRRALEIMREVGDSDLDALATMLNNLGATLLSLDRASEAEPVLREALEIRRRHFGADHEYVALSLHNLAAALADQGHYDEAVSLQRQALVIGRARFPEGHPGLAYALSRLAQLLDQSGDPEAALPVHREAIAMASRTLGEDHWRCGLAHAGYGASLLTLGRREEAREELEAAHRTLRNALGEDHPHTARTAALLQQAEDSAPRPR